MRITSPCGCCGSGSGTGSGPAPPGPPIETGCCAEAVPQSLTLTWHFPGCAWDGVTVPMLFDPSLSSAAVWVWRIAGTLPDACGTGAGGAPSAEYRLTCSSGIWSMGTIGVGFGYCVPVVNGPADAGFSCDPFDLTFTDNGTTTQASLAGGPLVCDGTAGCTNGLTGSASVTA